MRILQQLPLPMTLIGIDVVSIAMANWLAYWMLGSFNRMFSFEFVESRVLWDQRLTSFILVVFGVLLAGLLKGDYHKRLPFWEDAQRLVATCASAFVAEGFLVFAGKADVSRMMIAMSWMLVPFLSMPLRTLVRRFGRRYGWGVTRALIVGNGSHADEAARLLTSENHLGFSVMGVVRPGTLQEFEADLNRYRPEAIVLAFDISGPLEAKIALMVRERGLELSVVPVPSSISSGMSVRYVIGEDAVILVDRVETLPRLHRFMKRLFDLAVASLALLVFAVPMLVVAFLVKKDGGPVFFAHQRIGYKGKSFGCLKFRSMAVDAEQRLEWLLQNNPAARSEWEQTRKLKDDPRVTRIGTFIRKTALDELPQLLNVLKGDMSLVGPRPVMSDELEKYGDAAELYRSVVPGVTGLWQVSGRNDLSYDARVKLDTWYVRNWTPWHDIAILLKTIPALIMRRGAY